MFQLVPLGSRKPGSLLHPRSCAEALGRGGTPEEAEAPAGCSEGLGEPRKKVGSVQAREKEGYGWVPHFGFLFGREHFRRKATSKTVSMRAQQYSLARSKSTGAGFLASCVLPFDVQVRATIKTRVIGG